jgi:hypothetical protein
MIGREADRLEEEDRLRRGEYSIRYNSIIYNITPARKINTIKTYTPQPSTRTRYK